MFQFKQFRSFSLPAHGTERKSFTSGQHFLMKILLFLVVFSWIWQVGRAGDTTDIVWLKYTSNIERVQFSSDDSKILTSGIGGIQIFETLSGNLIKKLPDEVAEYSDDGTLIAGLKQIIGDKNKVLGYDINIYNSATYEQLKNYRLSQFMNAQMVSLHLSPDNKTVAIMTETIIYFVDVESGAIKKEMKDFGTDLYPVLTGDFQFSKDSKFLYLSYLTNFGQGNSKGKLVFINCETYQIEYSNESIGGYFTLSKDGLLLACGTGAKDIAVKLFNTQTHTIIGQIPGNVAWVTSKGFSENKEFLVLSSLEYIARIYLLNDLSLFKTINITGGHFTTLDISKDNKFIIGGAGGGLILLNFLSTNIIQDPDELEILDFNPLSNSLIVKFNLINSTELKFNFYDISGKLISNLKSGFYSQGQVTEELFIGNLSAGTYFLKIESNKFNKTYKILINR